MPRRIDRRKFTLAALALGSALVALDRGAALGPARAGEPLQEKARAAVAADDRADDRAAIRAAMQSFVKAFEAADAAALAGHWTDEGEYEGVRGTVTGRAALEKGFAAFFAENPKPRAAVQPGTLRFLSRDAAIDEGSVTIRDGSSGPPVVADYSALFVREDGRWRMARLAETEGEVDGLEDLAWLVGEWRSGGEDTEIRTTYSWNARKTFLKVHFSIKEKDRTLEGDQFLGKDPATGAIRAWTFESEGGIGEGTWDRDGDRWVVDLVGTMTDGSVLTSTNILTKVNADTFTWQSIDRRLGDEELPDLAPVKVTRVQPRR